MRRRRHWTRLKLSRIRVQRTKRRRNTRGVRVRRVFLFAFFFFSSQAWIYRFFSCPAFELLPEGGMHQPVDDIELHIPHDGVVVESEEHDEEEHQARISMPAHAWLQNKRKTASSASSAGTEESAASNREDADAKKNRDDEKQLHRLTAESEQEAVFIDAQEVNAEVSLALDGERSLFSSEAVDAAAQVALVAAHAYPPPLAGSPPNTIISVTKTREAIIAPPADVSETEIRDSTYDRVSDTAATQTDAFVAVTAGVATSIPTLHRCEAERRPASKHALDNNNQEALTHPRSIVAAAASDPTGIGAATLGRDAIEGADRGGDRTPGRKLERMKKQKRVAKHLPPSAVPVPRPPPPSSSSSSHHRFATAFDGGTGAPTKNAPTTSVPPRVSSTAVMAGGGVAFPFNVEGMTTSPSSPPSHRPRRRRISAKRNEETAWGDVVDVDQGQPESSREKEEEEKNKSMTRRHDRPFFSLGTNVTKERTSRVVQGGAKSSSTSPMQQQQRKSPPQSSAPRHSSPRHTTTSSPSLSCILNTHTTSSPSPSPSSFSPLLTDVLSPEEAIARGNRAIRRLSNGTPRGGGRVSSLPCRCVLFSYLFIC